MGRWAGASLWIMVCGVSGAAWAGQEFLIAGGGNDQSRPAISGTLVVWQEESNTSGTWDVKGADIRNLFSPDRFTVSEDIYGDETNPAISGSTVVYEYESELLDTAMIMMADLWRLDRPEVSGLVETSFGAQNYPVISGDIVAWQEVVGGDWDIAAVRISGTKATFLQLPMTYDNEQYVALEGTLLLWEQSSTQGGIFIMGCDAFDPNAYALPLFSTDVDQWYPAVSGHWATCATSRQIEVDNLADPFISRPVSGTLIDSNTRPAICQNIVVWAQKQAGQWDIFGYNLAQGKSFQITNQAADQVQPQISFSPALGAYLVVWADRRNGNWDIYGKVLDSPDQVGGCATALKGDVDEDCKVDALDVAEVQGRLGQINGVPAN